MWRQIQESAYGVPRHLLQMFLHVRPGQRRRKRTPKRQQSPKTSGENLFAPDNHEVLASYQGKRISLFRCSAIGETCDAHAYRQRHSVGISFRSHLGIYGCICDHCGNDHLLYTRFPWAPPCWSSSVGRLTPFPERLPGRGSTS